MKTKTSAVLAVCAMLLLGAPLAAHAESDDYTPTNPATPTLAGSSTAGECVRDAPWIFFEVTLTDPDHQVTSNEARLVLTNARQTVTLPLGELVDGKLKGRVLWPGASVDGSGNATGWPGWMLDDGKWVETDGNYPWTRGAITATIEAGPSVVVPLAYPPVTPVCDANPPRTGSAASLPATGMTAAVLPITVFGLLVVAGGVLLVLRRRSARR